MLVDKITDINYGKVRKKIISFMKKELRSSRCDGFVVGLSGGLDSSVVATLASEAARNRLHALILPSSSITPAQHLKDAISLAKKLKIKYNVIDLQNIHSAMLRKMKYKKLAAGNLLARLRMCMLYYYANKNNLLVLGTSDRSELLIGYYTKYGDGAADILPIASLYKVQVRALGQHIGLPTSVLTKKIGPMLWKEHTAEKEMGMPYEELDGILYCIFDLKYTPEKTAKKLGIPLKNVMKIKRMHDESTHKRVMPKICKL